MLKLLSKIIGKKRKEKVSPTEKPIRDINFNIHQLDKVEFDGSYESEEALEDYQSSILVEFELSSEGEERLKEDPEMGFWIAQHIYYGYGYIGVTPPQMDEGDISEIITDIFPKKISLGSPEDADDAIPELLAFWKFLKRQYKLSNADKIINFLLQTKPRFHDIMNDPSKFGMAKSFMTLGQSAGFDMTDKNQMNEFLLSYNKNVIEDQRDISSKRKILDFNPEYSQSKKTKEKKKKKRKLVKASRKKNKKKR